VTPPGSLFWESNALVSPVAVLPGFFA
jgi:hypothetical protein